MLGPADASRGLGVSPGRGGGPFPCYPCYPLHAGRKCACSVGVLLCVGAFGPVAAAAVIRHHGVGAREREWVSFPAALEIVCALDARQRTALWETQAAPDRAAAVQLEVVIVRRFEVETLRRAAEAGHHAPISLQIFGRNPFT